MPDVLKSLSFEDLPTKPPLSGRLRISDDLQQTIALLVGWDESTRRLLTCSPSGVIYTTEGRLKAISNILANQANYTWQGGDISTSEVMVKANPDNAGRVWVNVGAAAAVDTGYPLDAGDWFKFSVNNLQSMHLLIVADTEKAIVSYTK